MRIMPTMVFPASRLSAAASFVAMRKPAWCVALMAIAGCAHLGERRDTIEIPLTTMAGDAVRGREVFVSRDAGHCILCHAVPGVSSTGDVGPALQGVGRRMSVAQLRLRVADITRIKPEAAMPAFHRVDDLTRVAARYRGQPVLGAQQVEDVVAYMATLK